LPLISEVNYICSELSNYIQIAANQQSSIELGLKQSAAQRQNILKAAFSGQLVPQDPNDEPASVLLERIRAERAARANESKQRSGRRKAKGA
jgi:type I restriction enzyme S subunit